MSAGKIKDYKGPKTHHGIIAQIRKDLNEQNIRMSHDHIEKVVRLFFSSYGIGWYFRIGINCYVKGVGYFRLPLKVRKKAYNHRIVIKKRHNFRKRRRRKELRKIREAKRYEEWRKRIESQG